jgi:hypothetical protein
VHDLVRRFKEFDIDLSNSVERWLSRGNFLHSYNHPRIDVLIEILRRALVATEILPSSKRECDEDIGIHDDLSESAIWPVYPEIGSRHGFEGSLQWRMGRAQNYKTFNLAEFIDATFNALAEQPLPPLDEAPIWKAMLERAV